MIELPDELYENIFDGAIKRGAIIRTMLVCHDGVRRPHYYITLSNSVKANPLIFVISTSQLDFYNRHPNFNQDILRIPANKVGCFPLDTIIDCRKIFRISRERLKDSYKENTLRFCGELSEEDLSKIDDIIESSRFISKQNKKLILGENY